MRLIFCITETRRSVLFYSAMIFILQSLAPAFQGVMAKSVTGYTATLCTMYGPVTVFVKLEDDQQQEGPRCQECSVCILHANLNAQPVTHDLRLEARYLPDRNSLAGALAQITNPPLFTNFLSRAPPA